MENTRIPKLRFPGFTDDWEQRKFGDLADYKKGPFGSAITKDMFVPKGNESIKVYEQQNAINKDWSLERYFLPKEYALTKLKSFEVHGGDIIVSCAGTIGEIYEIPEDAESGVINQALMRVRVNESIVDKKMFIISFSNMIDDFTRAHSNGSAIKNIPPFADLKPMEVLMPSLNEQRKISEFFEGIDNLITLHQRKLDGIKEYKKGILQKMFPKEGEKVPELRFPGFTDDWEQRKLGDEFERVNERNNGQFGITHWISVAKMYYQEPDKVQSNNLDTRTYVMRKGDIAFEGHPNSEFQFGRFVANDIGDGIISELFPIYRHKLPYVNSYWKYAIQIERVMRPIYAKAITSSGASSNKLNEEHFLRESIPVPQLDEQRAIGEFFSNLNNLITLHQRKLDTMKEYKKGLLQQMFV